MSPSRRKNTLRKKIVEVVSNQPKRRLGHLRHHSKPKEAMSASVTSSI